jgi:FKBP-type peptidyl-prolyl cis-trans isomerase
MTGRAAALALILLAACGGGEDLPAGPSSLQVEDIVVGTGATAAAGDTVTVHYVGTLLDGTVFESSYAINRPYTFRLGAGAVIAGWDQGIPGMRVGGKRRLTIPPSLAYGSRGAGPIPPNATIRFEVELLAIAGR